MIQRYISEDDVIVVLESGTITEQSHGINLYEGEVESKGQVRTIQVMVDPANLVIVTVLEEA